MLSEKTIKIVKATAPVLNEHGERLTMHFYRRMFSHNPEVSPLFNPANQTGGTQQRALAAAICAYAANVDNLEALGNAVELIANKHVSLQIRPEHYPIVGENLLASIKEVLGEAASDDIINAWAEAYQHLSGILIGREHQIYAENKSKPGGWEGFRTFYVAQRVPESEIVTSFYLKPQDGGPLPLFKPGQYITLRLPMPDGRSTMRNFSLSDKPGKDYFRISVKREIGAPPDAPNGYVSNALHDYVLEGQALEVGPPCGEFFLDVTEHHKRPLVLMAAGIGVTPLLSILYAALEAMPERPIIFIHATLNERVQPFKQAILELSDQHPNLTVHFRYSDPAQTGCERSGICSTGMVTAELIESLIPERNCDYYFCGPRPFMANIYHELLAWGIPGSQVHFEFFGPRQELERFSLARK